MIFYAFMLSFLVLTSPRVILIPQDFGYVQTTSTEVLKSYIFNEPIVVDTDRLSSLGPAALFVVLTLSCLIMIFMQ